MHYERNVLTFFDALSDVGGLNGILVTIFTILTATWNYNAFDNFLISRLFKITKQKDDVDTDDEYFNKSEYIRLGNFPFFKEFFISWMPICCPCFKSAKICSKNRR